MRTTPLASQSQPAAISSDFVQSLERGLAVIQAFSVTSPRLTPSDVAKATGLTRSAARRFLLTLQHLGFVDHDEREFFLTPRVLRLGYSYLSSTPFWNLAQTHVEQLVSRVRESSSVSVRDQDEIVYVARVPTKRIMSISLAVGSRLPMYPTSMGRVLLGGSTDDEVEAYLERTELRPLTSRTTTDKKALAAIVAAGREEGWVLVDQELEDGVRSVAAPLFDGSGRVLGAVNVSAHVTRTNLDVLRRQFLPMLLETTALINDDLSRR